MNAGCQHSCYPPNRARFVRHLMLLSLPQVETAFRSRCPAKVAKINGSETTISSFQCLHVFFCYFCIILYIYIHRLSIPIRAFGFAYRTYHVCSPHVDLHFHPSRGSFHGLPDSIWASQPWAMRCGPVALNRCCEQVLATWEIKWGE